MSQLNLMSPPSGADIGDVEFEPAVTAVPWHSRSSSDVVRSLATDTNAGLRVDRAAQRLLRHGPNLLPEPSRRPPWRILVTQFADPMVLVLLGAAVLAGVIGEALDALAIVAILLLNAGLGFVQEVRAERAVAALRALAAPRARVRRDGALVEVDAATLVPGDVVRLEAGDVVPADLRLAESVQLRIAEAALTGESMPAEKEVTVVPAATPLGDRANMAYKGTVVASGRGLGVVVATGVTTELGRISTLLHDVEPMRTPLQRRLAQFTQRVAVAVVVICAVLFGMGLLRGEAAGLMFLTALSLAVAAIPEALPAVVTVALALGARRAAARQALIRRLPAVETLGSVTYICSDKTGTLTENRMRVVTIRPLADLEGGSGTAEPPVELLQALALCNDVERGPEDGLVGEAMEVALREAATAAGVEKAQLARQLPRVGELPFESERERMTTLHGRGTGVIAFCKGSPERIAERCASGWSTSGTVAFDAAAVSAAAARMAARGMRVLAFAMREFAAMPNVLAVAEVERDLVFLGLVGLLDPPRPEARAAVEECRRAGIRVVMVTGDHPATAQAIAEQVGITDGVHARVTPEAKLRIVETLQSRGEFVAMTGDGVNDAPALRRADIGIAMGRSGTDVAREAADLILLDDDFATIVRAVREGRRIYDNIRKFVRYALTCNSAEIWVLFLAPLLGLPIPLLPIHILWINLVTDGLPGLALVSEPGERRLMERPPRPPTESIFARGLWQHAVWVGLVMGGVTLATQAWAWSSGRHAWQSMTFTVLALLQLGHLLAIRSERDPSWTGFFRNPALLGAVAFTIALQLAVLYVPTLNRVLSTVPLSGPELAFCFAVSTTGFLAVEIDKRLRRPGRIPVRDPQ